VVRKYLVGRLDSIWKMSILKLRPPYIWYFLINFPLVWIAEKLNALPDNIRIFHNSYDYLIMLIVLCFVSSIPVLRGLRD